MQCIKIPVLTQKNATIAAHKDIEQSRIVTVMGIYAKCIVLLESKSNRIVGKGTMSCTLLLIGMDLCLTRQFSRLWEPSDTAVLFVAHSSTRT